MRVLVLVMTLFLGACAHQWTPEEEAALRAKHADACRRSTSQGGPCKNIWLSSDDAPLPLELQRALSGKE